MLIFCVFQSRWDCFMNAVLRLNVEDTNVKCHNYYSIDSHHSQYDIRIHQHVISFRFVYHFLDSYENVHQVDINKKSENSCETIAAIKNVIWPIVPMAVTLKRSS